LYAVLCAVHVAAAAVRSRRIQAATKVPLMPALALYAVAVHRERRVRVSRRLLVSLALACGGGVALGEESTAGLIVGTGFFFGAYAIYTAEFVRSVGVGRLRRWPRCLVPVGYATAVTATMAWLWPGLRDHGVAGPMAGYAGLMALMASTATTWGWRVGLGAGLLVASDTLIGIGLAGAATVPGQPALVMATYLAGLALVVSGWPAHALQLPDPGVAARVDGPAELSGA
jgi:uncharacterized membrane protein YhhN